VEAIKFEIVIGKYYGCAPRIWVEERQNRMGKLAHLCKYSDISYKSKMYIFKEILA